MHWPHPPDLAMMMGRLLERSETTVQRLDRIDNRLEQGDRKFSELAAAIEKAGKASVSDREKIIARLATVAIYLGLAWITGSVETAAKILQALPR